MKVVKNPRHFNHTTYIVTNALLRGVSNMIYTLYQEEKKYEGTSFFGILHQDFNTLFLNALIDWCYQ